MKTRKPSTRPDRTQWAYTTVPGHWDEAFRPSGLPRRHWRDVAVALGSMGFDQLTKRWQVGQQIIQANGVTYNVYGDPQGKERPWLLDPVPLMIDAGEWANIEQAIAQRATLLNSILADLYGEQSLIRRGHLPSPILFANPHFLRPCSGMVPNNGMFLPLYAADLARSPDGEWWVIADRTQAPSGIGYALENRLVTARTLPNVFSQCSVRPLNHYFDIVRESLLRMAPNHRDNPRLVLMTPGPDNESYFEHSFLARQWGLPLVHGDDLTVRDNRVYLKTLAGLEPVDMILRRTDDAFCDPLEFKGTSVLGVPGLTQAVRSGNVGIANALGSGLMETPAHMAFLPALSQLLLDEDLRMPSVATWWCGQQNARSFVKENLERLVIKPAFARYGRHPEFPASLSAKERKELLQRIEAHPEDYVAQEQVQLSTAPVRTGEAMTPRFVVLRVFAAWDGCNYAVMPGGLARVSTEASSPVVTMQQGGGSKDTWVLTNTTDYGGPQRSFIPRIEAHGAVTDLPSRVADNLFWLGRYTERVESGVRLVRALLPCLSGEEDLGQSASIDTAVQFLGALGFLPEEFPTVSFAEKRFQLQRLLSGMAYDPARVSSIGWNLNNVRRATWPLKERLSQDTWRVLQQLEKDFSWTPPVSPEYRMIAQINLLDRTIMTLSAFAGLLAENTTRGYGWRFLDIGKRLERALQTAELLLASTAHAPFDIDPSLQTLLQIADSSITYRSRYFTTLNVENVLELLLLDPGNPRSIYFQLQALAEHIRHLPGYDQLDSVPRPLQLAVAAQSFVEGASVDDLSARDRDGDMPQLEELLVKLKGILYDLSDALNAQHFSLLTATRLN